jgi:hypothetical protein
MVVGASRRNAVGAHATLRQARHQPTEASQRMMLHALVRGTGARYPRGAVTPRYDLGHEVLRDTPPARVRYNAMLLRDAVKQKERRRSRRRST